MASFGYCLKLQTLPNLIPFFTVKPDEKSEPETFYGMKEGESNTIQFKFRANPKPTAGVWKLGKKSVPVGASDTENTIISSPIENGVSLKYLDGVLYKRPFLAIYLIFRPKRGSFYWQIQEENQECTFSPTFFFGRAEFLGCKFSAKCVSLALEG